MKLISPKGYTGQYLGSDCTCYCQEQEYLFTTKHEASEYAACGCFCIAGSYNFMEIALVELPI